MKIGFVGFGRVAKEIIALLYKYPLASDIYVYNTEPSKVTSELLDLEDTLSFSQNHLPVRIMSVGYSELKTECDIVIIAASSPFKPSEEQTRMRSLQNNALLMKEIGANFKDAREDLKVIVISNPVDVMAQVFLESSALSPNNVFSSGTNLETSRLKVLLAEWSDVSLHDIHTFVLGEHGDSAFVAWSLTKIAGISIDDFAKMRNIPLLSQDTITQNTIRRAWDIVKGKGYTDRGIAASVYQILSSFLYDEKRILPVGTLLQGQYGIHNTLLSVPCLLGKKGRLSALEIPLSNKEREFLEQSAEVLAKAIKEVS